MIISVPSLHLAAPVRFFHFGDASPVDKKAREFHKGLSIVMLLEQRLLHAWRRKRLSHLWQTLHGCNVRFLKFRRGLKHGNPLVLDA